MAAISFLVMAKKKSAGRTNLRETDPKTLKTPKMPHFNPNFVTVKQQLHPQLHLQLQALQRLTRLFGHVTVTGGFHLANKYKIISNSTYILLHCYKIVISSNKYMSSSNLQHVTAM